MKRSTLVQNHWLSLFEDKYALENGNQCTYYHVARSDAVMAIAVEVEDREIFTYLVEQYRHPIGEKIWQFPLGGIESSEKPVESARKELREEAGLVTGKTTECLSFYTDPGFSNQRMYVCITSDIQEQKEQVLEDSELGLTVKRVPLSELKGIVTSKHSDAWTIIGYQAILDYVQLIE